MNSTAFSPDTFQIAVLDDNPGSRLLIERILVRNFGCRVRTAGSFEEIRDACAGDAPDLFLLDIVLGEKNGIDACRELKSHPPLRDVPVIFFSEHGRPQTRIEALRAGGLDYIDKPFYPEEFLQRVRNCVERFRHQKLLEAQADEQQALLRVLCHDLRNSVGATLAALSLYEGPAPAAERDECVGIGLTATRSALDLIAHVAEYRSLLDESRPFKLEPVDLAEACAESLRVLGPFASTKDVRLLNTIPPGLLLVTNRVVLVHNILNNLVNNAVKFSRPGDHVRVSAAIEDGPGGPECVIDVLDEGIGIPPSILEKLLKHQPVPSRPGTARETGTGLGMTLVALYVQRCGGRVAIESHVARAASPAERSGTRVELRFPLPPTP
jgi:signal transduction histidine kinase